MRRSRIGTSDATATRPTAAILFYRAHALSGNVAFIDELIDALEQRGLNALAVFTSSLRAQDDGRPAALALVGERAQVLISTLSFALGDGAHGDAESAFERLGIPVIQAITSGMQREAWEVSLRGLSALDTAINVAIPEFDGRIVSVPLSFKDRSEDAPGLYAPHDERTARVAGIAARLVRLQQCPRADLRVAFVLTNSSSKASQVGNAVGLDAPASLLALCARCAATAIRIDDVPETSDELMADLLARGSATTSRIRSIRPAHSASRGDATARHSPLSRPRRASAWRTGGESRPSAATRCAIRRERSTRRSLRRSRAKS